MIFAGIDGGQSATVAVLGDERGTILGRGAAGPSDHIGQGPDSRRLADAVEGALARALEDARLPADSQFEAIVAGISGFEGAVYGVKPNVRSARVRYRHDAPAAHAGAFALGPGVVVIAGTGSVAYGVAPSGEELTVGGWGFLFGDEGSAFDVARRAITSAAHAEDRARRSALASAALRRFEMESLRALVRAFYTERIDRAALAAFAADICELAAADDAEASEIVAHAARALMHLARTVAVRLHLETEPLKVALAGGLFENRRLRESTAAAVRQALPQAEVVPARYDPAMGALLLAYKEAGVSVAAFGAA